MSERSLIPVGRIERAILNLRGHNVMLDADLAAIYRVETKALVRAVRRNPERFPADFMFQLSRKEFENLRRHFGTSRPGVGGGTDRMPSPSRVSRCCRAFFEVLARYAGTSKSCARS